MIRKPPLRTYQRKGIAQSSFSSSQASSWAPNSYLVRKLSTNDKKINKPASTSDEKYIEEVSFGYLETTFDRIAKDARLPTPPLPISYSSINISSDVTTNVQSPDQKELFDFSLKQEPPKTRANKRPKRKPTRGRLASEDTEVVVKKRLKHDLINVSAKKAKAVRSTKRKFSCKSAKTLADNEQKQEIHNLDSSSLSVEASPAASQSKSNKNLKNKKKPGISYQTRKKRNIRRIFNSSSEKSSLANCSARVYKLNPKSKTNSLGAGSNKPKVCTVIDKISSADSNSSKIDLRDKKYEKNRSVDAEQVPEGNRSALTEIQYAGNTRKIRNNSDSINQPGCSNAGKYNEVNKENFLIKPCSIVLMKYKENGDPIVGRKESMALVPHSNIQSDVDIFESSISRVTFNADPESRNTVKISSHKSEEKLEIQSSRNRSDLFHNLDISGIKDCVIKITDCQTNEIYDRNKKHDVHRSLHYLKSSTPISAYVTIDRSMNRLSPIYLRDKQQSSLKNRKFSVQSGINKRLLMINDADFASSDKEYVINPKNDFRRKSSRKQLSISYEEDTSFEKSSEYFVKKEVKKTSVENIGSKRASLHNINPGQMKSPTSQIQKSLETLKIDLDSPSNRCAVDIINERRLLQREIFTDSTDTDRSFKKYENTDELTSKSKDSYSQLTPVGIISTRSGRQLKLTVTAKKKFFDDSVDPQIQFDVSKIVNDSNLETNYEIIENSENTENQMAKSTRFSVLNSHNECDSPDGVKRLNSTDTSVECIDVSANIKSNKFPSKDRISNNSMSYESLSVNARNNPSKTESQNESSGVSIRNRESGSTMDDNFSTRNNKRTDMSVSFSTDEKMSQSIINCTSNINTLSIKSFADENSEYPSSSSNNGDDSNDSEWITQSGSENNDSALSDIQEMTKDDLKLENQMSSGNNYDNHDPDFITITSYENSDSTTSEANESTKNESMENNRLSNQSLNSSQNSSIHNEHRSEDVRSSKVTNEESKSGDDQSLESNEIPAYQRIELLSTRINTRRRRRTLPKLDTKNIQQVVEKQSLNESPKEVCDTENETANLQDKLKRDSDTFKQPEDLRLKINLQPIVLIEKLKDPVKLSKNEKQKQSWGLKLTAISEQPEKSFQTMTNSSNESTMPNNRVDEACDRFRRPYTLHSRRERSQINNTSLKANVTTTASDSYHGHEKLNASELELIQKQSLFLKPGKEWTRSLSILNNIQNGLDMELLSTGKGKNWRNSVQSILNMQQESVVESCLRKNEDNKEAQSCFRASVANRTSCLEDQSIGSASPSRFIRRMSIRVVPDNKKFSHIEDTSFLEAYGISASKSRKTLSTRSSLKSDRDSLVCNVHCEDVGIEAIENEHIITARDVVLQRCCQEDYLSFTDCFPNEYLKMCRKIGEGVYGEVFLYENGKQKCVIKIIPIEGNALVNGERQKRFDEILSEIVTAKELHNLRYGENCRTEGFVEVKNIRCINGKYPEKLVELWKAYDNDKGSDNDCPSMFHEDQLYIVLELGHGGEDLEAFVFQSAVESHAIFVQAALALAVAEQSLEFEHRDLHWGNILISYTKNSRATYKLNDKEYSYPSKGMKVAIIDFTLSRMSYEGCCIFNDLALDPALFTAQGEYQFEIYRLMRDKIGNNWQTFEPYTNILWLHYVLDKMITALRYKRKTTKAHRDAILQLQKLKEVILDYDSAFDFITNCDEITRLQCKRPTTVKSTQVESDELDPPKR